MQINQSIISYKQIVQHTKMSDLLLNWLNDEIQLSKRITSFEEQFHNGYLFGELLSKYSQQLNFNEFVNKDDKDSRIKNFTLLLDTFGALRVAYDSIIAMKIINKNYGVAKKLLYQLKTQLEKTNANAFNKSTKMTKTLQPLKKIQVSKDKFDEVNKAHFEKQLKQLHPAQKEINQEKILKKFGDFQERSNMRATLLDEKQKQSKILLRNKFIDEERDNLKKSEDFRKQWEAENSEKWSMNMSIRRTQVQKDQLYKSKLENNKYQNKTMAQLNAVRSLGNDIQQFEKKNFRQKPKIIEDSSEDEQQLKESATLQRSTSKLSQTFSKSKQNKMNNSIHEESSSPTKKTSAQIDEKEKHQREKRRRKMIVEQNKRYQMIQITRRERYIVATIQQTSKQEKQIQYEVWRAWQNKNIILHNKQLINDKIKEKEETRAINSQFKKDQLLRLFQEEHEQELSETIKRHSNLEISNKISTRKQTYSQCLDMVDYLIDITEKIFVQEQQQNKQAIDQGYMQHLLQLFVEDVKENQTKQNKLSYKEQVCQLELSNYVEGKGKWKITIPKGQDATISENPVEENAVPQQVVNNYYLGNILKVLFEKYYTASIQQPSSEFNGTNPIIISLLGLDYSGKKTVSKEINNQYNVKIIQIQQIILERVQQYQLLSEKNIQISEETERLMDYTIKGEPIPNQLIIHILQQEIQKQKQKQKIILLIDFPNTYEQAIALTKVLKNIQPTDYIELSKLQRKVNEFSRLVRPTSAKMKPLSRKQCGLDFVIWIDIPIKQSIDRMLGRRWINEEMTHIRQKIDDANLLLQGQKASSLIMRNNYKLQHVNNLKQYLSLFGLKFNRTDQEYPCYTEINGNIPLQEFVHKVLESFANLIQVNKLKQQEKSLILEEQKNIQAQSQKLKKIQYDNKAKCLLSTADQIKNKLQQILAEEEIEKAWLQSITNFWNTIENTSINGLTKIFSKMYDQKLNKNEFLSNFKKQYISLLLREDQKHYLIKRFQIQYNIFLDKNLDMLQYDYTKEQLHQRVEDLENQLITIIEEKKEDAITERQNIINSGWLEAQFQIFYQCLYSIVQIQLNKYGGDERIINDFYCKKYKLLSKEAEGSYEINVENIKGSESFTKEGAFPRLEKIISQALRIFNKEQEVVDDKNKKGGKAPPAKKEDKKGAKKGGKQEIQQNKEPTLEELELKKAINTEKAIFRHRICLLKQFALKYLQQFSSEFKSFSKELEEYYQYTFKEQQKSIFTLTKQFKNHIEVQSKIQYQITIENVEIIINEHIRNFQREIHVILPAKEQIQQNVFTISNLQEIINLIKNEAEGERISNKRLLALLYKCVENQQLKKLFADNWKSLGLKQIEQFVKLLDHHSEGYVLLNKIFVIILLNDTLIPSEKQLEEYRLQLSNFGAISNVSEEKFLKTKAFFDRPAFQSENTREFDYTLHLKSIFYNLLRKQRQGQASVDVNEYIDLLSLRNLKKNKKQYDGENNEKYFDFSFKQI